MNRTTMSLNILTELRKSNSAAMLAKEQWEAILNHIDEYVAWVIGENEECNSEKCQNDRLEFCGRSCNWANSRNSVREEERKRAELNKERTNV